MNESIECNECKGSERPFVVPYDEVGSAIMLGHLAAHDRAKEPVPKLKLMCHIVTGIAPVTVIETKPTRMGGLMKKLHIGNR